MTALQKLFNLSDTTLFECGFSRGQSSLLKRLHYDQTICDGKGVIHNGRKFIYYTNKQLAKILQYRSVGAFGRIKRSLIDDGFIVVEYLKKSEGDRTTYYSLNYEAIYDFCGLPMDPSLATNPPSTNVVEVKKMYFNWTHPDFIATPKEEKQNYKEEKQNYPEKGASSHLDDSHTETSLIPISCLNTEEKKPLPTVRTLWEIVVKYLNDLVGVLDYKKSRFINAFFTRCCKGSLEEFEEYCRACSENDWLCGRKTEKFKAMFEYLFSFKVYDRIKSYIESKPWLKKPKQPALSIEPIVPVEPTCPLKASICEAMGMAAYKSWIHDAKIVVDQVTGVRTLIFASKFHVDRCYQNFRDILGRFCGLLRSEACGYTTRLY